jgi:hypothetical protein
LTLAVSRKNFMGFSFHMGMRNPFDQSIIGHSMKNSILVQSSAGLCLFDRSQTTG